MEKRWITTTTQTNADAIDCLSKQLNLEPSLCKLLWNRGIRTAEEGNLFFDPPIENLHDPYLMKDMDKAVNRLSQAIINNEKILVYGDYDVDGTSAVALLYSFLSEVIGSDYKKYIEYYIPDRYAEGYGISEKGVNYCNEQGFNLLISLDCGIKAIEMVDLANSFGIDVIICDHHLADEQLPNAVAILDPKRTDCPYPYKELSGCGVGFKLIQGYCKKFELPDELWLSKMDLVAISIASDIVAITGENRILAYHGLVIINRFPRIGIKSIIEQSGIKIHFPLKSETIFSRVISISDIVFYIGPRINAAGRMKTGRESVRLLICEDEDKSINIGKSINDQNEERRDLDQKATQEAIASVENSQEFSSKKSIVLYDPTWTKGIIGIVASRIVEKFYRPAIVLTKSSDGLITGSARSIKECNIYEAINSCSDLLEHFGGHKYAAGLSLKEENLELFMIRFEEFISENLNEDSFVPEIDVDLELDLAEITPNFVKNLKKFSPFGPGNMNPVFLSTNVVENGNIKIVAEKHLKMKVLYPHKTSQPIDAIAFNLKEFYKPIADKKWFNILYHIEENTWNNITNIQLQIKDIKVNEQNSSENGGNSSLLYENQDTKLKS